MITDRPELVGARWSSAVRCIAKAEHQALGTPGDPYAMEPLEGIFARGVNAAENWTDSQERLTRERGGELLREVPIPWGPSGRWTGHADAVIEPEHIVMEAYHSIGGDFREEKALQVAGYALRLGPEYTAMLAALDTTDIDIDGGFAVSLYPVDVDGLAAKVYEIEARIGHAYANEVVNPDDRVALSPEDSECQVCPFREPCWEGWEREPIADHPELIDLVDRLAHATDHRAHLSAAEKEAAKLVYSLRAELGAYVGPGEEIQAGDVLVRRVQTAPRRAFKLTDYIRAGHPLTPTMVDFSTESDKPGERWYVKRVGQ